MVGSQRALRVRVIDCPAMRHRAQDRIGTGNNGLRALRELYDDARMYLRFIRGVPKFLEHRYTVEDGRALLKHDLENRESNFLRLAERSIYNNPKSPYLPLLKRARCEFGDLRNLTESDGMEAALRQLHKEGVYVSFEEFKGREPMKRGDLEVQLRPDDFNNPFLTKHWETRTSGSTGVGTRNPKDLEHKAAKAPITLAIRVAQGWHGLPSARVTGLLPFGSGPPGVLRSGSLGHVPEKWFVPIIDPPRKPELRYRLAHHYLMAMGQLHGIPVPKPEPFRMEDSVIVARWAADTLQKKGPCLIQATVSMGLRIAIAARDHGIDLTGVTFRTGAEPLTEVKAATIEATGARVFANYSMSEVGRVGSACVRPAVVNDQHLMTHHIGVIQAPRRVGETDVNALIVTNLLPTVPRVLLNVEIDDYGVIETRSCGCPLDELGLHTHVRDIRSFGKLTAEGVTLVGSEMERILEYDLPSRFGGSPIDYQLVEEEDDDGFTRICLNISPSVAIEDEQAVIDRILAGLDKASLSADLAARLWTQAGAIRIRRVEPVVSGRGKVLQLRTDRKRRTSTPMQEGQMP